MFIVFLLLFPHLNSQLIDEEKKGLKTENDEHEHTNHVIVAYRKSLRY